MERRNFIYTLTAAGGLLGAGQLLNSCKSSTEPENTESDVELVTAGAEFEAMGVRTYQVAAGSGLITTQAYIDVAVAFMKDHEKHLEELNKLLVGYGRDAISVDSADPDPGVGSVTDEASVLRLAHDVEFRAASFYFSGVVNQIRTAEARRVFANILPVETAHFVTYKNALNLTPAIDGAIFEDMTSGLT